MQIPDKINLVPKKKPEEGRYLIDVKGEKISLSMIEALDIINHLSMAIRIDHEYRAGSAKH